MTLFHNTINQEFIKFIIKERPSVGDSVPQRARENKINRQERKYKVHRT